MNEPLVDKSSQSPVEKDEELFRVSSAPLPKINLKTDPNRLDAPSGLFPSLGQLFKAFRLG